MEQGHSILAKLIPSFRSSTTTLDHHDCLLRHSIQDPQQGLPVFIVEEDGPSRQTVNSVHLYDVKQKRKVAKAAETE
jgi:hypothetical protein